jgi:hypothetical protein
MPFIRNGSVSRAGSGSKNSSAAAALAMPRAIKSWATISDTPAVRASRATRPGSCGTSRQISPLST